MNKRLRYMITAIAALALAAVVAVVAQAGRMQRSQVACNALDVQFSDSLQFVSVDDVRMYLDKQYGSYIGQRLDSVKLHRIEALLESKSAVLNSEAWTTDDGVLHISITQRAPVIRFQKGSVGFYADDRGYVFPLHRSYTASVPTISGNIPVHVEEGFKGEVESEREHQWILDMIALTRNLSRNKAWSDRISGISVNDKGDVVLTPADGGAKIIFGSPRGLDDKLRRLEKYYTHIVPEVGEDHYKSVNVKYKGQLICRKDI